MGEEPETLYDAWQTECPSCGNLATWHAESRGPMGYVCNHCHGSALICRNAVDGADLGACHLAVSIDRLDPGGQKDELIGLTRETSPCCSQYWLGSFGESAAYLVSALATGQSEPARLAIKCLRRRIRVFGELREEKAIPALLCCLRLANGLDEPLLVHTLLEELQWSLRSIGEPVVDHLEPHLDRFRPLDLVVLSRVLTHIGTVKAAKLRRRAFELALRADHESRVRTSPDELSSYLAFRMDILRRQKSRVKALWLGLVRFLAGPAMRWHLRYVRTLLGAGKAHAERCSTELERALRIERLLGGSDTPKVMELHYLLGVIFEEAASPRALHYFLEASRVAERIFHPMDPRLTQALHDVGTICMKLERFREAENYFLKALVRDALGHGIHNTESHTDLVSLAVLWKRRRDPDYLDSENARLLLDFVMDAEVGTMDPLDPSMAKNHANRASLLSDAGDWEEAEKEIRKAIAILQKGSPHLTIKIGQWMLDLATCLMMKNGDREAAAEAEFLVRRSIALFEHDAGPDHPDLAEREFLLARLLLGKREYEEAFLLMDRAMGRDTHMLCRVFEISSENDRMNFQGAIQRRFRRALFLVYSHLPHLHEQQIRQVLTWIARRKGAVLESLMIMRSSGLQAKMLELWKARAREVDRWIARMERVDADEDSEFGPSDTSSEEVERQLALETPELARRFEARMAEVDVERIVASLPPDAALVEIVLVDAHDPFATSTSVEREEDLTYLAFTITSEPDSRCSLARLGSADVIDPLVESLIEDIDEVGRDSRYKSEQPRAPFSKQSKELRRLVFDPIADSVAGRRKVVIAPEGDLGFLPFEVLLEEDDSYLIDEYCFSYVNSGRDLLPDERPEKTSGPSVVIGNPAYDLGQSSSSDNGAGYCPLPGAEAEVRHVASVLGVDPWTGEMPTKRKVEEEVRSPAVLHIATHGIFEQATETEANEPPSGLGSARKRLPAPALSGLALVGAGNAYRGEMTPEGIGNGILTAEDIASMDLHGTRLVVLSGCMTGRGPRVIGEGIFGLRRALVLAGAESLVMSSWKVPDHATKELMIRFYQNLNRAMEKDEALRQARLWLRERYPSPWAWGTFICFGDVSPLVL